MTHTVLVLGADGYTGWPLTCHLLDRGYDVFGVDNCSRRRRAGPSVTPIAEPADRAKAARQHFTGTYLFDQADTTQFGSLVSVLDAAEPDTVVNLAQLPSAPFSMRSLYDARATFENNVLGSLNLYWALRELDQRPHVVQLATMGEYGTPDAPIPEGFTEDGRPAPKDPGSLYHASKVATTTNTLFLARAWDIPTTEVYQGIVYGVTTDETERDPRLVTRFDCDSVWGTVLNRFTAQAAVGHPLTVYGSGGQCRAMLPLRDSIQCLGLVIDNPPDEPYRAVNQFAGAYRVKRLAAMVASHTGASIRHLDNPRDEDDSEHRYAPKRLALRELGYAPTRTVEAEFEDTYSVILTHADRIDRESIAPTVRWRPDERLNREPVTSGPWPT